MILDKGATPGKIDNDWLLKFFDLCKNVSNEDLQYVWAKILANECNLNSKSSFKLLEAISDISSNEINLIRTILKECNYVVKNFEAIGIVFLENKYLEDANVKYEDIIRLEDVGIMKRELITLQDEILFDLENKLVKFIKKKETKGLLNLTHYANFYRFTHIGMEIINLIENTYMGNQFIKLGKALNSEYTMIIENK